MGSDQAVGRHVVCSCAQPSAHKSGRSRHENALCGCLVAACRNALGAAAVQGLHAQAKPPVYYVAEIDITDLDGWTKDYSPKAQALIKESGGRVLAAGQNVTSLEGEPPKKRVVIQVWDSMDQIKAWRSSAKFKELQPLREKYGKARAFTVEGLPN
jgi:uncharacterized protein (DUF1330 family)